jgi:hypothetical protein
LIDKGADFKQVLLTRFNGEKVYIAQLLKSITPKEGSTDWQMKQEIITYLESKGVDYRGAPVPKRYRAQFSQKYLDTY